MNAREPTDLHRATGSVSADYRQIGRLGFSVEFVGECPSM